MKPYRPLHGLPPLAGLATFEEAQRPGFSVEECVRRLKRFHYAFKRLHEIFIARLTAEPIYELKMAFSLHAHYCAEHAAALRVRVGEMREPPLGLDIVPDESLALFFDEILCAPTTASCSWSALCARACRRLRAGLEGASAHDQSAGRPSDDAAAAASRSWSRRDGTTTVAPRHAARRCARADRASRERTRTSATLAATLLRRKPLAAAGWTLERRRCRARRGRSAIANAGSRACTPPSPSNTTARPSATSVSPIPTTWA